MVICLVFSVGFRTKFFSFLCLFTPPLAEPNHTKKIVIYIYNKAGKKPTPLQTYMEKEMEEEMFEIWNKDGS